MYLFVDFSGPRKKWVGKAPNGARRIFVPTNSDLADILGRTDFDFENFYFFDFLGPCLGPAWAWAWAWAGPGPGLGPGLGWAWLGPGLEKSSADDPDFYQIPI